MGHLETGDPGSVAWIPQDWRSTSTTYSTKSPTLWRVVNKGSVSAGVVEQVGIFRASLDLFPSTVMVKMTECVTPGKFYLAFLSYFLTRSTAHTSK